MAESHSFCCIGIGNICLMLIHLYGRAESTCGQGKVWMNAGLAHLRAPLLLFLYQYDFTKQKCVFKQTTQSCRSQRRPAQLKCCRKILCYSFIKAFEIPADLVIAVDGSVTDCCLCFFLDQCFFQVRLNEDLTNSSVIWKSQRQPSPLPTICAVRVEASHDNLKGKAVGGLSSCKNCSCTVHYRFFPSVFCKYIEQWSLVPSTSSARQAVMWNKIPTPHPKKTPTSLMACKCSAASFSTVFSNVLWATFLAIKLHFLFASAFLQTEVPKSPASSHKGFLNERPVLESLDSILVSLLV